MTRFGLPSVMCDHEDGCSEYAEDLDARGVSSITFADGVTHIPSAKAPWPGWVRRNDEDFCPEHAPQEAP